MRSSDVSPSFLLPYDHSSVNPFPLPRHPSHKWETALGNSFYFLLKSNLSNPWSSWSVFVLHDAQSVWRGNDPRFWDYGKPSRKQDGMRGCHGSDQDPGGFSWLQILQMWSETSSLHCNIHTQIYLEPHCGSAKDGIISQISQKFPPGNPLQPFQTMDNHESGQEWAAKPILVSRVYCIPWLCCLPSTCSCFPMTVSLTPASLPLLFFRNMSQSLEQVFLMSQLYH